MVTSAKPLIHVLPADQFLNKQVSSDDSPEIICFYIDSEPSRESFKDICDTITMVKSKCKDSKLYCPAIVIYGKCLSESDFVTLVDMGATVLVEPPLPDNPPKDVNSFAAGFQIRLANDLHGWNMDNRGGWTYGCPDKAELEMDVPVNFDSTGNKQETDVKPTAEEYKEILEYLNSM